MNGELTKLIIFPLETCVWVSAIALMCLLIERIFGAAEHHTHAAELPDDTLGKPY